MAAQPEEITESNEDIHSVIRELLRLARKHDAVIERLLPLVDKYVDNPAARWRRRSGG